MKADLIPVIAQDARTNDVLHDGVGGRGGAAPHEEDRLHALLEPVAEEVLEEGRGVGPRPAGW